MIHVLQADCAAAMRLMPESCIDAIVTDPPYELGFMGKRWDASGIAFDQGMWAEALRVLKPGGHLLAFSGTRTYHRMACAIEDAGFEIRDQLAWMYGTGFPKSLNIAKAVDATLLTGGSSPKLQADTREATGQAVAGGDERHAFHKGGDTREGVYRNKPGSGGEWEAQTPDAIRWQGWGTALKPAQEPIVLARKPLIGTVAKNVLEHGTGGLNVDGCRISPDADYLATPGNSNRASMAVTSYAASGRGDEKAIRADPNDLGRWPANVILDEVAAGILDEQTADLKGGTAVRRNNTQGGATSYAKAHAPGTPDLGYGDSGGASRFFYCAKASKAERERGLEHLPSKTAGELTGRADGSDGLKSPRAGAGRVSKGRKNHHPTVKPIALMRYLARLITPPGGIVLDPFCGSGTTGCAAKLEGFRFVGIDLSDEYCAIARARIEAAE